MKKHFVTFLSPGTLFTEETTLPIDSWDVEKAVKMSRTIKERHGATPFAFQFSTRFRSDDELDSKIVNESGRYYLGGKIETYSEVCNRNDPKEEILRSNMRCNKWDKIVINTNSWRIAQPFNADDVLLDYSCVKP